MSSQSHSFCVEYAEKYGVECAILINHFQFWIEQNQKMGRNFYDDRTWMYQTQQEIAAIYPYWNRDKVQDLIKKLIDHKVLVKGNYNKNNFDKTSWYAFENEKMFTKVRNRTIACAEPPNPERDSAQPIPDTNTDTKQIQQQQAVVPAAVLSEKKPKGQSPPIYECLQEKDMPQSQKIIITREFSEDDVKKGISWVLGQEKPLRKGWAAALRYACSNGLSCADLDHKKKTPFEELQEYFENGEFYNNAECFICPSSIAFQRGMKHEEVKLDKYFSWNKLREMCKNFDIELKKKE